MDIEQRFGFQWNKYSQMTDQYQAQFLNWVYPLQPKDWLGKKFLDVGCGMGRNSLWPMKWGARAGMAFDYDQRSVARAKENLSEFLNMKVEYQSAYEIKWKNEFDIAFSIGVIHHLQNPELAVSKMVDALVPGGLLLLWVYSYEGNEWIVRYVDPVRKKLTSKMPIKIVDFVSYFVSIPLFLFIKIFKNLNSYIKQLSQFHFWHVHTIVFDQLHPQTANYWTKDEVMNLTKGLPLKNVRIASPPNKMGWTLMAEKV